MHLRRRPNTYIYIALKVELLDNILISDPLVLMCLCWNDLLELILCYFLELILCYLLELILCCFLEFSLCFYPWS